MRDDFTAKTKEILAKRVGFICSNPDCNMLTIGPNSDSNKNTSIGVAAHITAASEDGPRYNSKLSKEERKDISNGIWLCHSCSVLIDRDVKLHTAEKLRDWKASAERMASKRLNKQLQKGAMFSNKEDLEKIEQNGYYEKELNDQKVRYFLDGQFLHIEHELKDDIIAYYVMDEVGNIVENKFPYPLEEYELTIDSSLIIKSIKEKLADGITKETVFMKWGNIATIIWNSKNQLAHFNVKKGCTINHLEKKISIKPPEFK
ncbi:MAG: hypothetical protein RIC57_02980 [Balneola sp.]